MRLSSLKRWHWLLIAIVVGLAGGGVRQGTADEDRIDQYEHLITDPQRFEDAVTTQAYGHHLFEDITVYPYHLHNRRGDASVVHLVTGRYWDGEPTVQNGQTVAHFVSACFIASAPYQPRTSLVAERGNKPFPTVLDYLAVLHERSGVNYRYAWWWWAVTPIALWLIASIILIGGVWPTIINLITYGTFTRPAEEAGVSLKDVKSSPARPKPVTAEAIDPALLENFEDELESDLTAAPVVAAPTSSPAPPRPLSTAPLEPVAISDNAHSKEFGAKRDDFYPTELRTHPHK